MCAGFVKGRFGENGREVNENYNVVAGLPRWYQVSAHKIVKFSSHIDVTLSY